MTKPDVFTSTEKLLDVIRGKHDAVPIADAPAKQQPPRKTTRLKLKFPPLINIRKNANTGIDIGHDTLRLASASLSSTGHWRLDAIAKWEIPPNTPPNSPEFGEFLKRALDEAGGPSKKSSLWAIMSAAHIDVLTIRIPKVSPSQISNAVYWTLKKNNPFDEEEMFFDFEVQGEVVDQGISKLAVMAYIAPRREIEETRRIFTEIGRPLTGITIVPFALQNLLRTHWMESRGKIITSLYIGNDFSRIDIYADGNLVMTRGIKAGTTSMIEALVDSYNESRPESSPVNFEQAKKLLFSVCRNTSRLEPADAGFGLDEREIFAMIQPAMERIVRQVDTTFKYFATDQQKGKITEIFVSGALSVYRPILDYIGAQLDIACTILNPLNENHAASLCEGLDEGRCITERISFAPALGAALSGNDHTPNFIFTFKDKERANKVKKINRIVFSVFLSLVLIFGAAFTYLNVNISRKQTIANGLEGKLAGIGPEVNRTDLMKMASEITKKHELLKGYGQRYFGIALIGEFVARTPSGIRLVSLKMNIERKPPPKAAVKTAGEEPRKLSADVVVDGLIFGDPHTFDASLAGYVMTLEASPLLSGVSVQKSSVEPYEKTGALHFILTMKMEAPARG